MTSPPRSNRPSQPQPDGHSAGKRGLLDPYEILLWLLMAGYTWLFTSLAFDLHAGMLTHKADLGQIAQAVWNSSRGRFVEMTDNGFIATRMTDHVEPVLALISPLLWLWEDVRALLLLQVIFVAAGAGWLYHLTLRQLDALLTPQERGQIWQWEPLRQLTRPLALSVAISYLLAPQLQSALLTEFHAAPLVVPFVLWVLWAVEARRWWHFLVAALLVALVKEETALLAAGLGAWSIWRTWIRSKFGYPVQGVYRPPWQWMAAGGGGNGILTPLVLPGYVCNRACACSGGLWHCRKLLLSTLWRSGQFSAGYI